MSTAPVLRPLGVRAIVRTGYAVYRRHRVALWKIAAPVVALPAALGGALAVAERQVRDHSGSSDEVAILTVAVQVVTLVAFLLVTAAAFRMVIDAHLGRAVDPDASVRFGLRHLAPAAWVSLLAGVVVGGGFAVCGLVSWAFGLGLVPGFAVFLLPALYLAIVWSLAVPALLGERLRGRAALRRSAELVRVRFWPCLGVLALTSLLAGIATAVITILLTAFTGSDASDGALFVGQGAANLVSFTVVLPFEAAVTTILYLDLRLRKEGLGAQDDAGALAAEDPASA